TFRDHAPIRQRFCRMVWAAGYLVQPIRVLNASDYGVPQRRKRVFVIGCLESETPPEYPAPLTQPPPTVRDAIGDLMGIDKQGGCPDDDTFRGELGAPSDYSRRLLVRRRGRAVAVLTGCQRSRHSEEVIERFKATPPGGREVVS